jgi:hypothetical protein
VPPHVTQAQEQYGTDANTSLKTYHVKKSFGEHTQEIDNSIRNLQKTIKYSREDLLSCVESPLDPQLTPRLRQLQIGANLPKKRGCRSGQRKQRKINVITATAPSTTLDQNDASSLPARGVDLSNLTSVTIYDPEEAFPCLDAPDVDGSLRVGSFNARSVKSNDMAKKRCEIATFISDNKLDFLFVTETWFSDTGDEAKVEELAPPGYFVNSFPRPSGLKGGGIAVIAKNVYDKQLTIKDKFDFHHPSFQLVQNSLKLQKGSLHLLVFYRPPPSQRNELKNKEFIQQLPDCLDYANRLHGHVCFLGDANTHFDNAEASFTKQVNELLNMFNLTQIVDKPTHKKGHTLDWCVVGEDDVTHKETVVTSGLESDHLCLISTFTVEVAKPTPVYRYIRNIRAIDRISFTNDLSSELSKSPSAEADQAHLLERSLRCVLDHHAPASKKEIMDRESSVWFPLVAKELIEAKRERRRCERKWKDSGRLTVFKQLYDKAKHAVSEITNEAKCMYYNQKLAQASSSRERFQITDKLLANKKVKKLPTLYSLSELPKLFSKFFFSKIFRIVQNINAKPVNASTSPLSTASYTATTMFQFEPVSPEAVRKCILSSKPKTCQLDAIPTSLMIECLDAVLPAITDLFNSSLASGVFPQSFKFAHVTPILKKHNLDVNEFKNYRPVSNLSFLSKILEKLALSQLTTYLTSNNLFNELQSAYRQGHSTETALLKVVNDLLLSLDKKHVALLTLLDLSAAFDTIDHVILLKRLEDDFGIKGTVLTWLESYLVDRVQTVVVDGHYSDPVVIPWGVPQGSVLGPILFVLYTKPLTSIIKRHSVTPHSFADDSQLQRSAPPNEIPQLIASMQDCISDVRSWMNSNQLKLNEDKTEVMIVSSVQMSHRLNIPDTMEVGDCSVPFSTKVKNLGVTLDNHLEMTQHVQQLARSCNFHLKRISSIRRYLTPETTATLVLSYIISRLDYCNSLLFGCHEYLSDRLQVIMNNAARMVTRTPRTEHISPHLMSLHWLPVLSRIDYKIASLCYQCKNNSAPKYLQETLQAKHVHRYNTRSATDTSAIGHASGHSKKTLGDKSFSRAAPAVWNALPIALRDSESHSSFKSSLKTHLFRQAY